MAWGFGNISASTSMKSMAVDAKDKIKDFILVNHYKDDEDYYLFLIEGMPKNTKLVDKIQSDIEKAGYQSYIIASATNCTFDKDKVKVLKEHMKTYKDIGRGAVCGICMRVCPYNQRKGGTSS